MTLPLPSVISSSARVPVITGTPSLSRYALKALMTKRPPAGLDPRPEAGTGDSAGA